MSKLYKHYKNKPYKYLGEVRHSETLEELVLYETRYVNDLGTVWVRPKKMFFEEVQIDGVLQPRFKNIKVQYQIFNSLSSQDKDEILVLLDKVFGGYSPSKLDSTLANRSEILYVSARVKDQFVGFKLGYTYNEERFYSWLGAVDPEYRGVGVGQDLMRQQHQWCQKKGFHIIETRTKNKWQDMLILNIKNGFEIIGTYTNKNGETKIIMEKKLAHILK